MAGHCPYEHLLAMPGAVISWRHMPTTPRGPGPVAAVHRIFIVTALLCALAYAAWELREMARTGEALAGVRGALAMVSVAGAGSLLTPVTPAPHSLPRGVARGRTLTLGRTALAELRTRTTTVVPSFPLGGDATVALELRRFEPFAPGARVEAVDGRAVRAVKLPDHVYFTGTVRGEPDSRVLLIAARDHVRGFVAARGTVYPFGPDRRGRHRSYALRDVDPSAYPRPGAFCANDLHRDQ